MVSIGGDAARSEESMAIINKDTPGYVLYKKLDLYSDKFRREGKSELGWRFALMADMARKGEDWMHTCWHGTSEHLHIYSDIKLILETLWAMKIITNAVYYELYEIAENVVRGLKRDKREADSHGSDYPV